MGEFKEIFIAGIFILDLIWFCMMLVSLHKATTEEYRLIREHHFSNFLFDLFYVVVLTVTIVIIHLFGA